MKSKIIIGLLILGIILPIASCKKGENDPFLSLRSRKARISGEWELESKESSTSQNIPGMGFSSSSGRFSNGLYNEFTADFDGNSYTSSYSYNFQLNVEKSGSFESTERADDQSQTIKGFWSFLPRNKEAELKNKEAVMFSVQNELYTSGSFVSSTNYTNKGLNPGVVYLIDRLTNKEMILITEQTYNTNEGETYSIKETLTFKAK